MLKDGSFAEIAEEWGLTDSVCLGEEGTDYAYSLSTSGNKTEYDTLIVGFDAEFPPYGYKDENGEYVGFDLDLAAKVCEINGWELVKQPIDWNSKDMELNSGMIDCIWNGFTINGRETEYTWSKAYVDNSQVVIVKKDSGIEKLSDLEGKVVIVQADSSALAAFTGDGATEENKALCESFKELQQVADYNSAFMNLEAGVADAVCLDFGVANYQLANRGDDFIILDERVSTEQYGIGFKLGNTERRDQVQAALNQMLADGTFAEIAEEWGLSDSVCLGEEGTDYAYSLSVSGGDSTVNSNNKTEEKSFLEKTVSIVKQLAQGMVASLTIFVLTVLFSVPLGLLICMIRMSKFKPLQWLARIYISIMRGTPLMLQLLVVFFGPYYVFDISLSSSYRFYAVIIGFALNYAAYFAEIYRAGIESIPVGQYEAASVLGFSKTQTFWKIIFPQMVKRVIPPVTNEVITLVKDTSLAFAIAYTEMFTLANEVAAAESSIMPLFVAGVFYYVFNFVVAMVMERIEKKLQYYK
ncbi:MAG: ABC transporter permease subunit [Lachnospiraceae bacterium]|nr:ABC transporter permease subunit [Lachnospiraceae bacterium]